MKRFLACLFMALPMLSVAQSNFHKGYVVTNSKDTLKGYLDYKEGKNNPDFITFKRELNAASETYNLKNCAGFQVNEMVTYQRHLVNISSGTDDLSLLSEVADTSSRQDSVFLQVIQAGQRVTLFSYEDQIKKRYFIQDKEERVPQELIRQLYLNAENTSIVVTNSKYARQLMLLLRKYGKSTDKIERRLANLRYLQGDLLDVVERINDQQAEKSKFPKSRFFGGAGINLSSISFGGMHDLAASDAKSKLFIGPAITGGVDLFANPAIRRLLFRTELTLMTAKNKISIPNKKEFSFEQLEAVLTPQIIYHVYNADDFKVFVGAGIGFNFSSYKNQKFIAYDLGLFNGGYDRVENRPGDMIDLEAFHFNFPISAGAVLNKRIELNMSYSMPSGITRYGYFNVRKERIRVGINYLFGKY
ncbi:hypothetical protein [Pedobacter steynii]|uniref:Outer membrane protein beta-barrel domain-containing protein n=1 Tax=Pedobacter steynii TaxID=430522 RepID=A0A1D7QHB0_9SPHI|nr:hypothetical protein [Pedobacter steynii]AOM78062.1 hypothetical protein BFS30_13260 [Pedobacter steynii]